MAKIKFDIKFRPQIESGEYKVETRDGRRVRVLCWDRAAKEDQPKDLKLCVLVPENGGEAVYYYYSDGTKWVKQACFDLFIITPEPELSEWEKVVIDYKYGGHDSRFFDEGYLDKAKQEVAALLELARKEALKNLPRWKKADGHCFVGPSLMYDKLGFYESSTTKPGCLFISIEDLKKLPGFKED